MHHGYEPSRINILAQQSRWAVGALDGIHSTDPAAAEAMTAVAGLKSVIADDFIPAATTVGIMDPLGGSGGTTDWLQIHKLVPTSGSPYEQWMEQQFPSDPYGEMSDRELFDEFLPWNENMPFEARLDPNHPYWHDFPDLADEINRRSRGSGPRAISEFGQLLIDNIWRMPALPIAIATADFDPFFSIAILQAIFDPGPPNSVDLHRIEAFGVDLILTGLINDPEAMAQLARDDYHDFLDGLRIDDTVIFQLLNSDVIDQTTLAAALTPMFDVDGPVAIADIERAMVLFVAAANAGEFERGFGSPIATMLAITIVGLFSQLNGQISLNTPIYFDEIGDEEGILFGEYPDIRDLLGAILIDPAGMIILFAIAGESYDIVLEDGSQLDIQSFAELVREAFNENLDEIDIANARTKAQWNIVIGLLTTAIGLGPVGKSLGSLGGKVAREVIKRFGAIAASASSEQSQAEDVGHLAQIMILFGSYEGYLDDYEARGGTRSASARADLDQARTEFENGASLGKVSETLKDVRDEIVELGGRDFLDHHVEAAIEDIDPLRDASDLDR